MAEDGNDDKKISPDEEAISSGEQGESSEIRPLPARKSSYPAAFYCPLTKKVMTDPVVLPDGKSYERSAVLERMKESKSDNEMPDVKDESELYSNRALLEIIEDTKATTGSSIRAGMMRLQKSMRQSLRQVLDKSAFPSDEYRPLPGAYYCPITFDLIHVPTIDPEGNTYEKAAILNWIRANHNSPITRSNLETSQLYPNTAIADMLEELKGMSDDAMHPSIRKWKFRSS